MHNSIVRVDSALVAVLGGTSHRGPKTRASARAVAIDTGTRDVLRTLFDRQQTLATVCGVELGYDAYVFATEPGPVVPPHPDSMSRAFARIRGKAKVAVDIHLHSLRHFQSTELDRVISEAQKQARLGWFTVQMARHYTDAVPAEDRKAAEHIGTLLDGEPEIPTRQDGAAPSTVLAHPAPASHLPKGAPRRGAAPATDRSV